jgi:hypothetical protein
MDLKLNTLTGDIELDPTTGIPLEVDQIEDLKQRITLAMATWRGDWQFNILRGIPYDLVLGQRLVPAIESLLQETILRELSRLPGVLVVNSIDFDLDAQSRALSISVSVIAEGGQIVSNEVEFQI